MLLSHNMYVNEKKATVRGPQNSVSVSRIKQDNVV